MNAPDYFINNFCRLDKLTALMRKAILVFPDVTSISEFILTYKVSKAIVDSSEKTLKAEMSDKVLAVALRGYGAKIIESIQIRSFG